MKKCRNLANKLIMSICAVVVAVSAFFYVPMEVSAEEVSFPSGIFGLAANYYTSVQQQTANCDILDSSFNDDLYYKLSIRFDIDVDFNTTISFIRDLGLIYSDKTLFFVRAVNDNSSLIDYSQTVDIISKGSDLKNGSFLLGFRCLGTSPTGQSIQYTTSLDFEILSYSVLNDSQSDDFQSGYNAGYSDGEQAGYGSGYSDGYADGESSVDTGAIYDEAFQAGKDSVNTDSYYDAGYDAGYQVGVQESYEIGYEAGYQSAMERVVSWGADSSEYPIYITSSSSESGFLSGYVYGNSQVYDEESIPLNFDINPNHIYRFDVKLGLPLQTSYSNVYGACTAVYFCAGGYDYFISPSLNLGQGIYESIYVRGDMLSSSFSKKGVVNVVSSSVTNPDMPASFSFTGFWHDVQVYDVGPIGNMQNHIANQTDQLTNGFDSSTGDSVNSDFSAGLNDYQTVEDSLFATATTGMNDFTFFDFASVPAMVTGMSFVGSVMSSWFSQAGGASGVGIVLSILFSVMLVAMVLGLYRWYQSRGGKK